MKNIFFPYSVRYSVLIPVLLSIVYCTGIEARTLNDSLKGDLRVHDPVMIKQEGRYYIFHTGRGISIKTSDDRIEWKRAGRVFEPGELPSWHKEDIPDQNGQLWAPDIHYRNGLYHLYYSVSAWMNFNSSIGYAINVTLDPEDPEYEWVDRGKVISLKNGGEGVNVIDPMVFHDDDGRIWLFYGSYQAGLRMTELDPETGHLKTDPPELTVITPALGEGVFIIEDADYHYIFASRGICCKGLESTYQIVMGRSKDVHGPYLSRDGKSWQDNQYSRFLEGDYDEPGKGHNGFFCENDTTFIVYHAYTRSAGGASLLNIKTLYMDGEGWPTLVPTGELFKMKSRQIDRKALANRHNVVNVGLDTLGSLTIGNGGFAFTVDVTGLQTFPEEYSRGIPLGTQSDWGWHSFPNENHYELQETMSLFRIDGRDIPYSVQLKEPARKREAVEYFRINPHRLHLGTIGFLIENQEGQTARPPDIESVSQELDLWKGEIRSSFKVFGQNVEIVTVCHPVSDMIAFRVHSNLLSGGQLKILLRYPYPSGQHSDMACRWDLPEMHESRIQDENGAGATIKRTLDDTHYNTLLAWTPGTVISQSGKHTFELSANSDAMEVSILFTPSDEGGSLPDFRQTRRLSAEAWEEFWMSGGAVDFSGSTDPRANELERRIVLSQYLTRVQCAGDQPPQETGLTYNSWYGKFHLEMAWWHMVHFSLWGRTGLMEKSLSWYPRAAREARNTSERQGYEGIRWQKMTDPSGADSPSSVGSFLIWQQPHYIYFAELCCRNSPTTEVLEKHRDLVFATADFMASYPLYNQEKGRYELGPVLIPAQECFDALTTFNPPFELSYWYWGLSTAIRWAERLHMTPHPAWVRVLEEFSPLYVHGGLYVPAESVPLAYIEGTHMHDHPAVLGAFGVLPGNPLIDTAIVRKTFDFVWENWHWEQTWGWDFPLTAMSAVRLGQPEKAIDALFMQPRTNTYLANGHNYQDGRLRLYLPGNGGLLTAVAMMCAGYDGCTTPNPGIPKNGTWQVRWEGLVPIP